MTRRGALRLVALATLAAQLIAVPAAWACAAAHSRTPASHCGTTDHPNTPVLTAGECAQAPQCASGPGCVATAPALLSSVAPVACADAIAQVPAELLPVPPSFDASPTPPPPQL